MGNCSCLDTDSEIQVHDTINRTVKNWEKVQKSTQRLLLLGSGASGKSTLFKQLKSIHGDHINESDRLETLSAIRQNLITGMIQMLRKGHELYEQDNEKYNECKLDKDDEKINNAISKLIPFFGYEFTNMHENIKEIESVGQAVNFLWSLPNIQATYKVRGNTFAFPENMEYFFNRAQDIMKIDYIPTDDDVLRTRIRTTGIIEYFFNIDKQTFYICDVGGQRNERRKWIHAFSEITAVIFVAALNHYNALCFEDETKNAMHESIELFREICISKWFRKAEIILFLNKNDLFVEFLKEEIPLSVCFGKNSGWKDGALWDGPDYCIKNDPKEDELYFVSCYREALQFIENVYINNCKKQVFIHVTCATDKSNVDKVFWDVQNVIIRLNLHRGGLLNTTTVETKQSQQEENQSQILQQQHQNLLQ